MTIQLSTTVPIELTYFALMFGVIAFLGAIFILCKYDLKSKAASKTTQNIKK